MKNLKYVILSLLVSTSVLAGSFNLFDLDTKEQIEANRELFTTITNVGQSYVKKPEFESVSKDRDQIFYFATYNLTKKQLKNLFISATEHDATIVFRGLKFKEGTIQESIKYLHSVVEEFKLEKIPNVLMDPSLFSAYRVEVSPTIVYQPKDMFYAYKVAGLITPNWLIEKSKTKDLKDGSLFDYGIRGEVIEIIEEDLITNMKERVREYDWEAAKKRALQNYFDDLKFVELAKSKADNQYEIDLSLTVKENIYDQQGRIVAKKGKVINPSDYSSLNQYIVVIDGMDEDEIDFAKDIKKMAIADNIGFKVIVTRFDKSRGFKSLSEISNSIGTEVKLLDVYVKNRLHLESTPSVIYSENKKVILQQFNIKRR